VKQLEQNHAAINGQPLTQAELSEIDLLAKPGLV
jgi:hypothetical protein